jgi:type I restriction enzyme M protein
MNKKKQPTISVKRPRTIDSPDKSDESLRQPQLSVKTDSSGRIFSHIRRKWLIETPEESVRQQFVTVLVNEYGFAIDQMDEELEITGRGTGKARADIVVWRTIQDKTDARPPLIAVECKSDNVTIKAADYHQGENYARLTNAPFFVTHNNRETRYWRVRKDRMPGYVEEIENIPHSSATDKDIEELIAKLRTFKEDEFADLLHQCHNVIRNREHLDPAAAFDEIAKILFIKVWVERELRRKRQRRNLFTADWLDSQLGDNPLQELFRQTKDAYRDDRIFDEREQLNLKLTTGREIVRLLERYNLSDTSEDVKGIAFERFLGKTFRGEIGQFFTPRTIVEFMVRMVQPKEGDTICDPASGSGGFLIRFFELVREQILADVDRQYQQYAAKLNKKSMSKAKRARLLRSQYADLQDSIDPKQRHSRLWELANRCIYGTDANDRMARTSKMNMIMHGDGHGGVHHHNGFINVNGIFEGRFDIILTNPPFGANVEPSDLITDTDVKTTDDEYRRYLETYGSQYKEAYDRVTAAKGRPLASLFDLPKRGTDQSKLGKVKTELLFIERCLSLLKPGGRMGIVLPEGIFNNPSLSYVREFCEDRAHILAIVSLPQETFFSSGATVKASLLFLQRFTDKDSATYEANRGKALTEIENKYATHIADERKRIQAIIDAANESKDVERRKLHQRELAEFLKKMIALKAREARSLIKQKSEYPIFSYEAEKVGISATGENDLNELYPNSSMPARMPPEESCLGRFLAFQKNPNGYDILSIRRPTPVKGKIRLIAPTPRRGAFSVCWSAFERWDTFFWREDFVSLNYELLAQDYLRLGDILHFISRGWKKGDFPKGTFRYIEVSSVSREEGIRGATMVALDEAPSRATTLVHTGDFILSTTRPYLGAFARVPAEYDGCVCSSAFALADSLLSERIDPDYLLIFLKGPAGLRQMERRMTGGLYPAIIQDELENVIVPIPSKAVQARIIKALNEAVRKIRKVRSLADQRIREIEDSANSTLLGQ